VIHVISPGQPGVRVSSGYISAVYERASYDSWRLRISVYALMDITWTGSIATFVVSDNLKIYRKQN